MHLPDATRVAVNGDNACNRKRCSASVVLLAAFVRAAVIEGLGEVQPVIATGRALTESTLAG